MRDDMISPTRQEWLETLDIFERAIIMILRQAQKMSTRLRVSVPDPSDGNGMLSDEIEEQVDESP